MKVLITNNALVARGGSELYVRDIALELLKRGHTPVVYSTVLGDVANELRAATIPVVDNLNDMGAAPDVIHGHHHMETMTALLHFPGVPAVQFCHSWSLWYEMPVTFPRILRYVAVDNTCRDRLIFQHSISSQQVEVLLNFVDLNRFRSRDAALPLRPQRAVVFSNYATERTHLPAVRKACARANISLDVIGSGAKTANRTPELSLVDYDLVFAKARCALESLSVGCAVILCDSSGLGPMVTSTNLAVLRPLNFGIRTLSQPLEPELIAKEIERYDADDANRVSQTVRASAGRESAVDHLITIYEDVIQENQEAGDPDLAAEGRAAATYLRRLKIDFAAHGAASLRLRERLERLPLLGKLGLKIARSITGPPGS